MAWLEKRKRLDGQARYRIRDLVDGKKVTVVKDAGLWKALAETRLTDYVKQKAAGAALILTAKAITIQEACEIYEKHRSQTVGLRFFLSRIKKHPWPKKSLHELHKYDVGNFLATFKTVGSTMRYLRVLITLFNSFKKWNDDGHVLPFVVKLPAGNPAHQWRAEMKPGDKKEHPRERVLSPQEWQTFSAHLSRRARAICELALLRFLRLADIKQLTARSIRGENLQGLQAKTGEPFKVPVIRLQPKKYDFTNFRREFEEAQKLAGMDYPKTHPLHFSVRDLRRTGATWAYNRTLNLIGISKMLGHTSTETTRLYLHVDEVDRKRITDVVDAIAFGTAKFGEPVGNFPENERS